MILMLFIFKTPIYNNFKRRRRRRYAYGLVISAYLLKFNILNAPLITKIKTIVPTNKSGLFEFNKFTKIPAMITPKFIMTSFDVKIILAFICACSLLFDFCKM